MSKTVKIELTDREFRRLLDLVYVGNWIMNSTREEDRIPDYDELESKIFAHCRDNGADALFEEEDGVAYPSAAFQEGGIHEAIADYEDQVFFEILAEELARRDMGFEPVTSQNFEELAARIDDYISEFEENGLGNITLSE